nr:MAG TPA: hypothetical protein [Caudoviricetes sp.]
MMSVAKSLSQRVLVVRDGPQPKQREQPTRAG